MSERRGRPVTRTQRGRFSEPEPKPSFNQHPQYEQWKNICPNCRSHSTTHYNGKSEEFNVMLRCIECGYEFSLEQAFKAEQQPPDARGEVSHENTRRIYLHPNAKQQSTYDRGALARA